MASSTSVLPVDPVQRDERQAHAHEDEAQSGEASSLNLWPRVHWLLLSGNDTDVKQTWEDED